MTVDEKISLAYEYATGNAYRFEPNRYLRKDLVHDVILYLLSNREKVEEIQYIKSWVYRLMKWRKWDTYKSSKNYKNIEFLEENHTPHRSEKIDIIDQDNIIRYIEEKRHIRVSIYAKGTNIGKQPEVFKKYIEGYTQVEIAEELGCSLQTIRVGISETCHSVRKHFELELN